MDNSKTDKIVENGIGEYDKIDDEPVKKGILTLIGKSYSEPLPVIYSRHICIHIFISRGEPGHVETVFFELAGSSVCLMGNTDAPCFEIKNTVSVLWDFQILCK